jgi:hypothetical protein
MSSSFHTPSARKLAAQLGLHSSGREWRGPARPRHDPDRRIAHADARGRRAERQGVGAAALASVPRNHDRGERVIVECDDDWRPSCGLISNLQLNVRMDRQQRRWTMDKHLTEPDPALAKLIRRTPQGMMHWAGTGPHGATCGKCEHYGYWYHAPSKVDRQWKKHGCGKYWKRMHRHPNGAIPATTEACKYFEAR